ncbi:sulfatase [Pedobacter heparinus]|uniref:Sulfatase n=1 Tax=Pedobacter heparinus (strain ATCC 13125 / DSM 2366 / CIP 104194 / JCM 7457 / NBRC 12017 / NCIMB 9290 / NRRL B-14731 / HIM 762-3) TaxID=485917 RepID=C6Y214_PEDHD|nr:sulfatase [Pedobacter heparinus]ACU03007.1 sulfatase [Pedobacter heparinus DSM 2366]
MKGIKTISTLLLALWTGISAAQVKTAAKPNVIVIVSDDAGYVDFGCYGGKQIPTPNIDAIAKQGTRFTDAYVSASVCAPSRAGILTGRYQQRFGFEHNTSNVLAPGYKITDVGMDPSEQTIGNEMQANGYKTIAIGKWHQGDEPKHFPLNRGFNEFYGFTGGHRDFFAYKGKRTNEHALYNNKEIVPENEITYLTDMFTDKATSFITANKDKPFFMYLSYNAVHTPMNAKKDLMERYASIADTGRRAYAAMMTSLDDGIGKVMATLKANQLDKNTLIIFINDNGGATVNSSDNGPLRGMKGSKWEGGIRVAMMMKWPGHIAANKTDSRPVSSLDILPTAIGAGKGKQKGTKKLDGVNLLPYLSAGNKKTPHEALYWRRGVAAAMREGNWKLIRVKESPTVQNVLLFDLSKDLSETKNLSEKYPAKVKELLVKLAEWEKGLDQPHWYSSYGDQNQIMKHRMETTGREMERMYP